MKHLTSLILLFFLSLPLHAGSADAIIKGKSASGRTVIELHVQDMTGGINYAKVTIDGESYTIEQGIDADQGHETTISDSENGIYVIVFETPKQSFRFWMVPKSNKVLTDQNSAYKSKFKAILETTDPRTTDKWKFAPRITLNCSLDYSI